MQLSGAMLIGGCAVRGSARPVRGVNRATGETLEPEVPGGTPQDADRACALAWATRKGKTRFGIVPMCSRPLVGLTGSSKVPGGSLLDRFEWETVEIRRVELRTPAAQPAV